MSDTVVSLQDFTDYMDNIEKTLSYQDALNDLFDAHNVEGYICRPDCAASLIRLLSNVMGIDEQDDYITKFVFDSKFGKSNDSSIKFIDRSNKERHIKNAKDLYFLITDALERDEISNSSEVTEHQ